MSDTACDAPAPAVCSHRDVAREGAWLQRAEQRAGLSAFAEHAARRLAAGETAYGDRWVGLGLERLLRELREEAADLGAWGVLALQALDRAPSVPGPTRERLARSIYTAIVWGAHAHRALVIAQRDLAAEAVDDA
jgi:hypothetical protein